jgi:hypothetical protein
LLQGQDYVERKDQRHTDFTLHGTRTNSQVKELTVASWYTNAGRLCPPTQS